MIENLEKTIVEERPDNLVDLFLQQNKITADDADKIRKRQDRTSQPEYEIIEQLKILEDTEIYKGVAFLANLEFVSLEEITINKDALKLVTAKVALHYKFIPIDEKNGTIKAVFHASPSMKDKESLRLLLGKRIHVVIATPDEISSKSKKLFGLGADKVLNLLGQENTSVSTTKNADIFDAELGENADDGTIIQLVNQVLKEALDLNASDIHLEPFDAYSVVRLRIDGLLAELAVPAGMHVLHKAIVSRLKVMANLNLAEHRLPHDGRLKIRLDSEEFDLRVSILPTRYGETICLRILNRSNVFFPMEELGFHRKQLDMMNQLLTMPHGLVLITGPTGSGKTTTLYAALAKVDSEIRKVITVEDPVEYQLDGISQIEIRANIGLTFAAGLRSILRHDPDIILVGEIRDGETAEIAIRSSLTGHLVLSTLHTNDSVGAVNRLIDMGIEPFLVAASLVSSIAQRLVRKICEKCKVEDDDINDKVKDEIVKLFKIKPEEVRAWKGNGCSKCSQKGTVGRVAINEFFLLEEELKDMVSAHIPSEELRKKAIENGMITLRQDGWRKVLEGKTTIEEVQRITSSYELEYFSNEFSSL